MMSNSQRDRDTITSADLPDLRAALQDYIADDVFSEEFHGVCQSAIAAIDQARDDDEETHAPLAASLARFATAGQAEIGRCALILELCNRINEAESVEQVSAVLTDLLTVLPAGAGERLADGILDQLTDALTTMVLVEMPAATETRQ